MKQLEHLDAKFDKLLSYRVINLDYDHVVSRTNSVTVSCGVYWITKNNKDDVVLWYHLCTLIDRDLLLRGCHDDGSGVRIRCSPSSITTNVSC